MYEIMKTIIILITLIIATFTTSCKKDTSTICENIAGQGGSSLTDLKGEWEFKHFAYTPNGDKIKDKDEIQKGYINVTDTGSIWFYHTNTIHYQFSLSGSNSINLTQKGSTFINPPQEEITVSNAFNSSICYVVKGTQLLIHYKEDDKKNVLILNKK
jgi:hypothetical protein